MAHHHVPFRLLADLTRVAAAVGVAAALFEFPGQGAGARFLLVLLVLFVPRAVGGVPAPLDLAFGATLLTAAWTSVHTVAPAVGWLLHVVATSLTAVVLWLVLDRATDAGRSAHRSPARQRERIVGQTGAIGLVVAGSWECARWLEAVTRPTADVTTAVSPLTHVLAGVVGSVAAGWVLAKFVRCSRDTGADVDHPRVSGYVPYSR